MPTLSDRIDHISRRLILMSLNIHIELNNGRFSLSRLNEIRKYSDLSLVSSSPSNTLIDELFVCMEYYCNEINKLSDELRLIINSLSISTIDDLLKDSQICLNDLQNYHHDRIQGVESMLSNPYREDAWYFIYEIDSNIFVKCRMILTRLRMYFLLMHQILTTDIDSQLKLPYRNLNSIQLKPNKRKRESIKKKHDKILDFKV